jgi:copper resistance protein B
MNYCTTLAVCLYFLLLPVAFAADEGSLPGTEKHAHPSEHTEIEHDHMKMEQDRTETENDRMKMENAPEVVEGIEKYEAGDREATHESFGARMIHEHGIFAAFLGDRLEYQTGDGSPALAWDVQAWVGGDFHKLWLKSEGTWSIDDDEFEEAQAELFYSRNVSPFWDLQIGVRHDFEPDPERTFAALGIQGLAPLWFEIDATAYVSEDGDLSAALEAEYDVFLTQRLVLQPRFETSAALQEVEEYGVGQGINEVELGLRLRYEIRREFAPYIGVSWNRKIGETENLAEAEGEDIDAFSFVVGLKAWF